MLSTFYHVNNISTDALFRSLSNAIHNGIVATGGWIVSTETGEVNLATMTRPAINTYAGFKMYRMSDALQSTAPLFLKLRFGTSNTLGYYALEFQIGQGTNGSGTLTGLTSDVFTASTPGIGSTDPLLCFVSVDPDRLNICLFATANTTNEKVNLGVSRTRNSDGTSNAYGFNCELIKQSGCRQQLLANVAGKFPTTAAINLLGAIPLATSGIFNGEQGIFPVVPHRSYPDYPDLVSVFYIPGEIPVGAIIRSSILGTVRSFLALGSFPDAHIAQSMGLAMRFE